ncbi:MAG: AAA family ATPase, partial [Candidatus Binatia bacterium]
MARLIERPTHVDRIRRLLRDHRVVALVGARQVGKSTLARMIVRQHRGPAHWYDLENARDLARLAEPLTELEGRTGLVVLDEIQRRPELFPA